MSGAKLCFAIPGELTTLSGGYAYDRQMLALLPREGIETVHVALPAGYPFPTEDAARETAQILASLDRHAVVMVDGLALGAIPPADLAPIAGRLIALVHHPLALETGLAAQRAQSLHASERAALACVSRVVVTGPEARRALIADYGVPEAAINVALPGTIRPPPRTGSRMPGPLRLLAVGAIIPRKGYGILVDALSAIAEPEWRLTIAGRLDAAPDTVAALRAQIRAAGLASHIDLAGPVSEDALAALYRDADIFVMPSLYEGFGMVAAEALAHGLPIVASTGGALVTTVPDAAALKVPPGDRHALREALARALGDAFLRQNLAQGAARAGAALPIWEDAAAIIAQNVRALAALGRPTAR